MSHVESLTKAIAAHGMWKHRLDSAVRTGKSDVSASQVLNEHACEFGHWLDSLPVSDQVSPQCVKVKSLHAAFHKEAANVVSLAIRGMKAEAEKSIGFNGAFSNASSDLTAAMMEWKRSCLA